MHLCAAMPAADQDAWGAAVDQDAWGAAVAATNAELPEPAVWVGHGPLSGCDIVDVCPSSEVLAGAETRIGR
jgi:hypothetical protein